MATTQEMIKARELMKTSGLTLKDAVAQARTPATPVAPVAGVPPAPTTTPPVATTTPVTPTAPTPVDPTAPQVTGVDGQKFTQAPVDPTTGLSKPIEPTTPATPTTAPEVDKTAEIKAKNEARLAEIKAKNQLETDKTASQKLEAESQLANNEGAILNTLKTGGIIPETVKSSPYYKTALANYNKLQQYSTYSIGQLTTAMNQGSILPGTAVYNEMMKDPAMKAKLTEAQIYSAGTPTDVNQVYQNASTEILASNPKTASMLDDGLITLEEYNQATNNEAIIAKAKEVEEKTNKYNQLYAEYEAIEDEVKAQFPGSPFADSIIADRQKAKYKNVLLAKGEMDTANGTLTELKAQSASLFETNLKLYEQRRAEQIQREAEQRQNQFSRENMYIQNELSKENAVFQNSLQQGNASFQTIGDKVYKVQNGQMTDTGIKAEPNTTYQAVGGKLYKIKGDSITDTGISAIEPTKQDWKQDASGNWYDANSPVNPASQTAGTPAGLLDYISASEGTNGNYNAMYGKGGQTDINLTGMTIKEIQDLQRKSIYKDKNGNYVGGAMGKYQIVSGTLQGLINRGVVKSTDYFDEATQDKMAMALLGNSYADYKAGKITADQLQNKVSGIWAGVPNTKGTSTYASDGTNKARPDNGAFLQAIGGTGTTGTQGNINQSSLPLYRAYMEDGKLPSKDALKGLGMTSEQFVDSAQTGYDAFLASKAKEINSTYPTLQVEFTPSYSTLSATQREKLNESMTKIGDIDMRLEKLKKLFVDNGTEVLPTKAKKEMQSLKQQIILKAKEVENLGVLNGPDLGILESLIPETTGISSGLFSFDDNTLTTLNSIQNNYQSDAKTKGINYGTRISFKGANEPTTPTGNQTNDGTGTTQNYGGINLPAPNPAGLNLR